MTPANHLYSITPDLGRTVGPNLFHSFSRFDLTAGETANFSGPNSIQRVFARVTGGSPSSIDGTLQCTIPNASFYLINPAGVIFGPNAALDLQGSFTVTTADYLRLGNSGRMDATSPPTSVLTTAAVSAFGFLGKHPPALIQVSGRSRTDPDQGLILQPTLITIPGKSLTIVSGGLVVDGGELAASGTGAARIACVASGGEVFQPSGEKGPLDVNGIAGFGPIRILNQGFVGSDGLGGDAGPVSIWAGDISVDGTLASRASAGAAGTFSLRAAGTLTVRGENAFVGSDGVTGANVHLTAADINLPGFDSFLASRGQGGDSGEVAVEASQSIAIGNGAYLGSTGDTSGAVRVTAGDLTVDGFALFSSSVASTAGGGAAGDVAVSVSRTLRVTGGAFVGSDALGGTTSGAVAITALSVTVDGSVPAQTPSTIATRSGSGGGGLLQVFSSGPVTVTNGGFIGAQSHPDMDGTAGAVQVQAQDVVLDGSGDSPFTSGIFVTGNMSPAAPALIGDLLVTGSRSVLVRNGAAIDTDSFSPQRAGSVLVKAPQVTLEAGGSVTARSFTGGSGGSVSVAGNQVILRGGSISSSNVRGAAAGGKVTVSVADLTLSGGSTISATGGGGLAKELTVDARFSDDTQFASTSLDLVSPTGARVQLNSVAAPGTYQDRPPDGSGNIAPIQYLATFTAKDLIGQWKLESHSRMDPDQPGTLEPVTLLGWSLRLGKQVIGRSGTTFSGLQFASPLTVAGVAPGVTDGRGGEIQINATRLTLSHKSQILAGTSGSGGAGGIDIETESALLTGQSMIESASMLPPFGAAAEQARLGPAGSAGLRAGGSISVADGASISVASVGAGAGTVSARAGRDLHLDRATLTAQSAGDGGNVDLRAGRMLVVDHSVVTAAAGGNGGQIRIDPPVVLLRDSTIDGLSQGRPVLVRISGPLLSSGSTILTDTPQAFPQVDIVGALVQLPRPAIAGASRLEPQCGLWFSAGDISSFILTGNGGEAPRPDGWLGDLASPEPGG